MIEDFTIKTQKDLEDAVEKYGILPLFKNSVPGFSVEEHVHPLAWFSADEGVWEWKGPVIRNTGCAYGKFFANKAVFISKKWFPDFANWRRDGYDFDARFDDELASYDEKKLFDLVDEKCPVLSGDLKKAGNYGKNGNKGFDTIITRLQALGYVLTSDFVYQKDRFGNRYGWGVAQYSTPEKFFGPSFREHLYDKEPEESFKIILEHVCLLNPDCDRKTIERYLKKTATSVRTEGRKDWLVPSNYKYFDVIEAFEKEDVITWKQGNDNMRPGDIAYIYVGAPFSAILFRCEIVEADIPYTGGIEHVNVKKLIRIKRFAKYEPDALNLKKLKEFGVVSVRCARSAPAALSLYAEKLGT